MPKRNQTIASKDDVTESEHYVAIEVDSMTVRQKLECLEAYRKDHTFVCRSFKDIHDSFVEVFVFEKRGVS